MTLGTVSSRRLFAAASTVVLAASTVGPGIASAGSGDPELLATLEHPRGDIEYEIEPGTLHFFDEENAPFAVQIIDGCAIDDHLWVFGAGLSGIAMPLEVADLRSGEDHRLLLPAYEPGAPIGTILEPGALELCSGIERGGLPTLSGTATLSSADHRAGDYVQTLELRSLGSDDSYRRIVRDGAVSEVVGRGSPVAAVDTSKGYDELVLLAEGRMPRRLEGVVFSGGEDMLPARAKLTKALKGITNGRVRRAFEAAKNGQIPKPIIEDLGLRGVDAVHHVGLQLGTLGTDAYLADAGWIKDDGTIARPEPVAERFTVELATADGETRRLPLLAPLVGSEAEGHRWEYAGDGALVHIIDGCDVNGSYWTIAGAATDEPLELRISDTVSGTTVTHLLWTDKAEVSRLSDTSSLTACS